MALSNLSIYSRWKKIKSAYNNNKYKISALTWNDKFDLLDRSYSISSIQDYFEYIFKKHEIIANNPHVEIYVNKMKNRIVFKIMAGYKLENIISWNNEIIKKYKKDVDQDKDAVDVPKLESVEIVLVHCNSVNNNHQQVFKVFHLRTK